MMGVAVMGNTGREHPWIKEQGSRERVFPPKGSAMSGFSNFI